MAAMASNGAIDSTVILSSCFSGGNGSVSDGVIAENDAGPALAGAFSRVKDDGLAEAMLLAYYGMREEMG